VITAVRLKEPYQEGKMSIFKNSAVAIVTPFKEEDLSVNYDAFADLIDFQIDNGTDAIVVCGSTGEAATMTEQEHLDVCKFCIDYTKKRVPVIAGSGSNCTQTAINLSKEIAGYGAMMHTSEDRMLTDYAVVGEATENDIAIGSRGRCCVVVTITGKSCHASIPHTGANPFAFLSQLLPKLEKVELSSDEMFGSSTMSLTRITSSEKGSNIIPNEIQLFIDFRQTGDDTLENVEKKIQACVDACEVKDVSAKVEILYFPLHTYTGLEGMGFQGEHPFFVSADADYIVQAKAAIEAAVGHEIKTKPWAFATDTGHYSRKGTKCLGYSPAEIKLCHTTEDSISIEMMAEGTVGTLAVTYALANNEK
jgi:acetylornithine deacetylase/succinyl-diaminopimelate desuccinylase-like protein